MAALRWARGSVGHPVGRGGVQCTSCHDPHAPDADPPACATCHDDADRGGHGAVTCAECHRPHEAPRLATAATDPAARRCLACHQGGGDAPQLARWSHPADVFTPEGGRWTPLAGIALFDTEGRAVGNDENGALSCASCHETHRSGLDHLRKPGVVEACAACHGDDARELYLWFHRNREGQ